MELPTYTNIWKIEKRLYKLYDFRLPMPLPVGQIAAFLAIAVPYMLILTMVGMPFSHTWVWLYVLPPGVLAWLVTRPVLEGKRLPELVVSQLRYVSEPRTWCRMAPLTEKDDIVMTARVWRAASPDRVARRRSTPAAAAPAAAAPRRKAARGRQRAGPLPAVTAPRPAWRRDRRRRGARAGPRLAGGTCCGGRTRAASRICPAPKVAAAPLCGAAPTPAPCHRSDAGALRSRGGQRAGCRTWPPEQAPRADGARRRAPPAAAPSGSAPSGRSATRRCT